jgi:hypothetical protein
VLSTTIVAAAAAATAIRIALRFMPVLSVGG